MLKKSNEVNHQQYHLLFTSTPLHRKLFDYLLQLVCFIFQILV